MVNTTVILVAPEGPLSADIRKVVLSTHGCQLERFGRPETALVRLLRGGVGLVVVYLADSSQAQSVVNLLCEIG